MISILQVGSVVVKSTSCRIGFRPFGHRLLSSLVLIPSSRSMIGFPLLLPFDRLVAFWLSRTQWPLQPFSCSGYWLCRFGLFSPFWFLTPLLLLQIRLLFAPWLAIVPFVSWVCWRDDLGMALSSYWWCYRYPLFGLQAFCRGRAPKCDDTSPRYVLPSYGILGSEWGGFCFVSHSIGLVRDAQFGSLPKNQLIVIATR